MVVTGVVLLSSIANSQQSTVNISIQIYDNIIRTRCCCGSNFHYWKSTEIDKHGLRYFIQSILAREAALSQGRQDWWQHYDNLSHIWWMFGISDWGEGISLSGWGSLDRMMRKISQHLHWGNILQSLVGLRMRLRRDWGERVHLYVRGSFYW